MTWVTKSGREAFRTSRPGWKKRFFSLRISLTIPVTGAYSSRSLAIASRRAMRSSIAGWVLKATPEPCRRERIDDEHVRRRLAVASLTCSGIFCAPMCSLRSALAKASGSPVPLRRLRRPYIRANGHRHLNQHRRIGATIIINSKLKILCRRLRRDHGCRRQTSCPIAPYTLDN